MQRLASKRCVVELRRVVRRSAAPNGGDIQLTTFGKEARLERNVLAFKMAQRFGIQDSIEFLVGAAEQGRASIGNLTGDDQQL